MRVYLVGGAVRDRLLGQPQGDRDWVVVGATPDDLLSQGYRAVGRDFPVFLHPDSGEEYALARTERKTGAGYRGFVVQADASVTLEDDLARRDLTVNAIAEDPTTGTLIDPHGGVADLRAGVLRHVSEAFVEDPVRILRLARFAARWPSFSVAPETLALVSRMVDAGEVDALVPERVWAELSRGLMAAQPSRMFELLHDTGVLARLLPEVDRLWGVPQRAEYHPEVDTGVHLMMVLDMAARLETPLTVRFACLGHDLGKGTTPAALLPRHHGHEERSARLLKGLVERLRVPAACAELADVVAREHGHVHGSGALGAAAVVRLFDRCDAWRRPERFAEALWACECDARGRLGFESRPYPPRQRLAALLAAARAIDAQAVVAEAAAHGQRGPALGDALRRARVDAVAAAMDAAG